MGHLLYLPRLLSLRSESQYQESARMSRLYWPHGYGLLDDFAQTAASFAVPPHKETKIPSLIPLQNDGSLSCG